MTLFYVKENGCQMCRHTDICDRIRYAAAAKTPNDIACSCGLEDCYAITCPECFSGPGETCLSRKGNKQREHVARIRSAHSRRANLGCQGCQAEMTWTTDSSGVTRWRWRRIQEEPFGGWSEPYLSEAEVLAAARQATRAGRCPE